MIRIDKCPSYDNAPARQERGLVTDPGQGGASRRVVPDDLTSEAVANLTLADGWPCLSVLMPTIRDLPRALHRTPPHLVVRVDEFGARV